MRRLVKSSLNKHQDADTASGFTLVLNQELPSSAYIHVPFCQHRCGYCDFTLVAQKDHLIDEYLKAMEQQLAEAEAGIELKTLFLGGGTPTHLSIDQLQRLFDAVFSRFQLAADYEFSIEANPLNLSEEKNRLSETGRRESRQSRRTILRCRYSYLSGTRPSASTGFGNCSSLTITN